MVRITGHRDGSTALDCTVNSAVGLPVVTGPARPSIMCFRPWDVIAGPTAATGIREAVRRRGETGEGESISLALSDVGYAAVGILGHIGEAMVNRTERAPIGNDLYGVFGRDFATKDGRRVMVLAITARAVSGGACSTPSAATSPGSFMMPGSPLELRRLSLCVSPGKSTRSADATPGSAGVSPAGGPKDHRCSLGASHGQDTCPRCRARNIEGICAFDRHRSTSFYVKYENEKSISYGKFHASAGVCLPSADK